MKKGNNNMFEVSRGDPTWEIMIGVSTTVWGGVRPKLQHFELGKIWIGVKDNFCLNGGSLAHSCHAHLMSNPNLNRYEWEIPSTFPSQASQFITRMSAHVAPNIIMLTNRVWSLFDRQVFIFSVESPVFVYPLYIYKLIPWQSLNRACVEPE